MTSMPRQAATAERRLQPVSVVSVVQRRPRNSAGDSRPLRAAAADKRNQSAGDRTAGVVRELCFVVRLFSAAGRPGGQRRLVQWRSGRPRRVASRRASLRFRGQFRRRIIVDFVSISSRSATNDTQSADRSVCPAPSSGGGAS